MRDVTYHPSIATVASRILATLDQRKSNVRAIFNFLANGSNTNADDTKLSRVLSTIGDRFELQEGLNDFMNWAEQWQLRVAEHKCLVLSHGNCDAPGKKKM